MSHFVIIEIEWHGPFTIEEILKGEKKIFGETGIYQIYGDHPVNGSDNLLYLGHTLRSFQGRLKQHHDVWIKHEPVPNSIYLGVIWESDKIEPQRKELFIKESEKLLTYYCSPPYNSSLVYDINHCEELKGENIMIINLWQKHRLPYEVSSRWYYSDCWYSKRNLLKLQKATQNIQ